MGDYYHDHAEEYIASSLATDMRGVYPLFLSALRGKRLLDVGFGSGRDMAYFQGLGYEVEGIDPEEKFVAHARSQGLNAFLGDVRSFVPAHRYDGIWACASLLHLSKADMEEALGEMKGWLAPGGVLFVSLKDGEGETIDELGRVMTYVDEAFLKERGFEILSRSKDASGRNLTWLNALYRRG